VAGVEFWTPGVVTAVAAAPPIRAKPLFKLLLDQYINPTTNTATTATMGTHIWVCILPEPVPLDCRSTMGVAAPEAGDNAKKSIEQAAKPIILQERSLCKRGIMRRMATCGRERDRRLQRTSRERGSLMKLALGGLYNQGRSQYNATSGHSCQQSVLHRSSANAYYNVPSSIPVRNSELYYHHRQTS
jgi:hypothetical protein